jgi:hypothetical protein
MSLIATRQDFEPANATEGATALYYEPSGGFGYRQYPFFQARINSLIGRAAPNNQKLAIWGCGFGYLVQLAVTAGYDAHGYDSSAYAISRGQALLPSIAARLHQRDALVSGDMTPSRRDAGLAGAQKFALLVTEDLLPCMSDAEISTTLPLLRGICNANLLHIVTPDPGGQKDLRINWKTADQWHTLLSPPDVAYDAEKDLVL